MRTTLAKFMYTKYLVVLLLFSNIVFAQKNIGIGLGYANNTSLKSHGVSLKSFLPITNRFSVSPSIKYYPNFNTIHEYYINLQANYSIISPFESRGFNNKVLNPSRANLYTFISIDYNNWINYKKTALTKAKKTNALPFVGLGVQKGSQKIKIFIETRYNILWNESGFEIGLIYFPNSKRNTLKCP